LSQSLQFSHYIGVQPLVLSVGDNNQIARTVVGFVTIDVMHLLRGKQRPSNRVGSYLTVL